MGNFLADQKTLIEGVKLRLLSTDILIPDDNKLAPPLYAYAELSLPNTLGLSMSKLEYTTEKDYLEDYGRNLSADQIKNYVEGWRSAGYLYELTSAAGRGKYELMLMIALAAAIAKSCNGYVIVMHGNFFSVDVGVYSPDEFSKAIPSKRD